MLSSLCETDYVYNNNTGLCEKPLIIPPDHCTPFNNYNFVYNANTKKCEYNIYDEKIEDTSAIGYGYPVKTLVCPPGYPMDPSTNICTKKTVINILLTKDPVCAPTTRETSDKQCKRRGVFIPKEPNKLPISQSVTQQADDKMSGPAPIGPISYKVMENMDQDRMKHDQEDSFIGTIQAQNDSFIGTIQSGINQLPPQSHQQAHKIVPQPAVKETNNTLIYILLFIMFVIALGIGYFYTNKKK